MIELNLDTVLDFDNIFTTKDKLGNIYLCVAYNLGQYLGINIEEDNLEKFIQGKLDLKEVIGNSNLYLITESLLASEISKEDIREDMLPCIKKKKGN